MSIIKDFKDFISRGNVIDLAIGVVIGGAFGSVVNSLVKDVLMPPLGLLVSGIDFKSLVFPLAKEYTSADPANPTQTIPHPAVVIAYGNFISETISFLIIALTVFFLIQIVQAIKRIAETKLLKGSAQSEEVIAAVSPEVKLLQEIRDLLAKNQS